MVAIVSGAGLGLFDTSANQLNGAGALGTGTLGQAGGKGYVNVASGNLILQFNDETLSGSGADIRHLRTYNSLGTVGDGDNDRWRWLGEKRVTLSGTLNAAGSRVTRTTGDGHAAVFNWDAGRNAYVSAEGGGADDTIVRSGSEWIWTEGSSKMAERYNASTGWIKNSRDLSGNGFNYTFSGNLLTRITDVHSAQTLELKYSNNRLVRVETRPSTTGAVTQQVHYAYDSSGRLTRVTTDLSLNNSISDGNTYVTNYTYDGSSTRVKSISQSDGTSVNYTYINNSGRYKVHTVTDQTGVTTFTYSAGQTQVRNGEGETTTYYFDNQDRLTRVNAHTVGGKTQSVQYAYDSKDNVIRVTDGKGEVITYTYDSRSNLTRQVNAAGNVIERTYSNDRLVTETRSVGSDAHTTRFAYDSKGRLRYTISAEGHVSENRYTTLGQLAASIRYTESKYAVSGLSKTATLSESQLNGWLGNVNRENSEASKYEYNHRGQLVRQYDYGTVGSNGAGVLNANTTQTEYVYSAYGELLQTIAVTGNSRTTNTTLESRTYDGMGRVLSVVNDKGTTTTSYGNRTITVNQAATGLTLTSAFDGRGKLLNVTQTGSGSTRITRRYYDNAGRVVMIENATGGRAYTIYDNAGRVSHRVSELGAVVGYTYDENGRMLETRQYHNKVSSGGWFNGSVVSQKTLSVNTHSSDRITRYVYDKAGRLTTTTEEFGSNDRVTTTAYDSASQVISTTVGDTRVTRYFYDKDGRVVGTLNGENFLTENVYDNAGRLSAVVRYGKKSGVTATDTTTLATLKNSVDDGNIQSTHYFYDAQGRQIGVLNEQGYLTETVYDVANRKTTTHTYTKPLDALSFRNQSGVSVDPQTGDIKRTAGGNSWGAAGVESENALAANTNGWVQFTASETNTYRMIGLNRTSDGVGNSYSTIDYAIYTRTGGSLRVYENGANKGDFGTYKSGDVLRVERVGTTIYYKKNGTTFYTSSVKTSAALRVDASLHNHNATIKNIEGSFFSVGAHANTQAELNRIKSLIQADSLLFRTQGGVAVDPHTGDIRKTAGGNSWGSAGVESSNTLAANTNGWAQFTASETNTYRMFGLNRTSDGVNNNYTTIDYAIYTRTGGSLHIYENGTNKGNFGTYKTGDVLRVERVGNTVYYKKNGSTFYTSTVKTTGALRVDSALHNQNATIKNIEGSFFRSIGRHTTITNFDTRGRVSTVVNHEGTVTRNTYNGAGRLIKTIVAEGGSDQTATRTRYNDFGEVTGVVSGVGEAAQSNLNTAIDQYGTAYQYDQMGRKIVEEGPQGQKTFYYYDKEGRLTYTVNALGEVSQTTYTTFGDVATVTVLAGSINTLGLTGGSQNSTLINRVDSAENSSKDQKVTNTYNLLGLIASSTDGEGKRTNYGYDKFGDLRNVYTPYSGSNTTRQYLTYDKLGRVQHSYANYDGIRAQTTTYYDGFGQVVRVNDANGKNYYTDYLDNGRTIRQRDALGREHTTTYDALGRELKVTDATGQTTTYTYSNSSRSVIVTTPEGIQLTTWSTRTGQTLQIRDGNGGITKYTYDKDGNVKTVTDALNKVTTNTYDRSGRLYETKDANGNVVRFTYDVANRTVQQAIDPTGLNLRTRYTFDGIGQTVDVRKGYGTSAEQRSQFIYDRNGRVKQEIIDPAGLKLSTRYTYDDAGNRIKIERGTTSSPAQRVVQYKYDELGRVTEEIKDPGTGKLNLSTKYRYDKNGNLTRMIYPNGQSVWYIYNNANERTYEVDALGQVVRYDYDKKGNISHKREYHNKVSISGWGDVRTSIGSLSTHSQDRRTYTIRDENNRERFTLTTVDGSNWVATENVLDKNSNVVETRRFDRYVTGSRVSTMIGSSSSQGGVITEAEMIAQLRATGFRARNWNDSTDTLFGSRRTRFAYDKLNRLRFTVDANGYITEKRYDNLGNVRYQTSYYSKPNSLGTNYSESYINTRKRTHSSDRTVEFRYDRAGRLQYELSSEVTVQSHTSITGTAYNTQTGQLKKRYHYDAIGQVTKIEEGTIDRASGSDIVYNRRSTEYRYDKAGRQNITILAGWYDETDGRVYYSKENQSDRFRRHVEVTYDALGNAVRNKSQTGMFSYGYQYSTYDGVGRLEYSIDAAGYISRNTYDALSNIKTQTRFYQKNNVSLPSRKYYKSSELSKNFHSGSYNARIITHKYDAVGRKTSTILPSIKVYDVSASRSANASASTGSTIYNASPETQYYYNSFNEVTRERVKVDKVRWTDVYTYYDNIGRVKLTSEKINQKSYNGASNNYYYGTKTEYNALGDTTKITEYANKSTNASSFSSNSTKDRVTFFTYDQLGQTLNMGMNNITYVDKSSSSYGGWTSAKTGNKTLSKNVYNAFGEVTKSTDAIGNTTDYSYNRLGQLVKVQAPTTKVVATKYSQFGGAINARPITNFKYDVFGNVIQEEHTSSNSSNANNFKYSEYNYYDNAGNQIRSRDGDSGNLRFKVDANGRVIRQTQSITAQTSTSRLRYSHTLERRFAYDLVGRQIATTDIYSSSQSGTRHVFNAFGEVTNEYKVWGSSSEKDVTKLSRVETVRYTYDKAGNAITWRDTNGNRNLYYDLRGKSTRTELKDGDGVVRRTTEMHYDLLGRTTLQRMPSYTGTGTSHTNIKTLYPKVSQTYDRWGNVLTRTAPNGGVSKYQYNHANQVIVEETAEVKAYSSTTASYTGRIRKTHLYSLNNQLAESKETRQIKNGSSWQNSSSKGRYQIYDNAGNVIRVGDATNKIKEYIYDIHGNRSAEKDGVGNITIKTYNKKGQVLNRYIRGSGSSTNKLLSIHFYDQAGRLYLEDNQGSSADVHYRFDQRGNLTEKIEANGKRMRYTFDARGNKTKEEAYTGSWQRLNSWGYSTTSFISGRIANHTVSDGSRYIFSYNDFGEIKSETFGKSKVTYDYWQNGLLKSKLDYDTNATAGVTNSKNIVSTKSTYHYDISGLKTIEETDSRYEMTGSLRIFNTTINLNIKNSGKTTARYSYDKWGRLTLVTSPTGTLIQGATTHKTPDLKSLEYRYDIWGNRRAIKSRHRVNGASSDVYRNLYYNYDNEGRVLRESTSTSGGGASIKRNVGVDYTYDAAGRKATERRVKGEYVVISSSQVSNGYGGYRTVNNYGWKDYNEYKRFAYDQQSRTVGVYRKKNTGSETKIETHKFDSRGFKYESIVNSKKTTTKYDSYGRVTEVKHYKANGSLDYTMNGYSYESDGNTKSYKLKVEGSKGFTNTYTYSYINTVKGRQASSINVDSTQSRTAEGKTSNRYDHRGRLVSSTITESNKKGDKTGNSTKSFIYNVDDQIVRSSYRQYGESKDKIQSYFYFQGQSLANIGDEGVNIAPIATTHEGGSQPFYYTVIGGETLGNVAQSIFGDSSLWYVIADANSLSMGPMDRFSGADVGRSLKIPNSDQSLKNNSTTFKPYSESEIIGDLTPDPRILPPPKKKCNIIKVILIVVVAVVATIFTAGAAAMAMAGTLGGAGFGAIMGAGSTLLAGGAVAGIGVGMGLGGTMAAFGAAFVAGAVGSIASQAVGVGLGVQDKINFKSAFASGLTTAATMGLSYLGKAASYSDDLARAQEAGKAAEYAQRFGHVQNAYKVSQAVGKVLNFGGGLGRAAAGYVTSYAANKAAGLETSFSWKGMAAQAIGSVAGNYLGGKLPSDWNPYVKGTIAGATAGSLSAKLNQQWNRGGPVDYGSIALDAFANQLANAFVDNRIAAAEKPKLPVKDRVDETQRLEWECVNCPPDESNVFTETRDSLLGKLGSSDSKLGQLNDGLIEDGLQLIALSDSIDITDAESYSGLVSALRGEAGAIKENPLYNYLAKGLLDNSYDNVESEVRAVTSLLAYGDDAEIAGVLKRGTLDAAMNIDSLTSIISAFDYGQTNKWHQPDVARFLNSGDLSTLGRSTLAGNIATLIPGTGVLQAAQIWQEQGAVGIMGDIGYLSPAETSMRLSNAKTETVVSGVGAVTGAFGKLGVAVDALLNFGDSIVPKAHAAGVGKAAKSSVAGKSTRTYSAAQIAARKAWFKSLNIGRAKHALYRMDNLVAMAKAGRSQGIGDFTVEKAIRYTSGPKKGEVVRMQRGSKTAAYGIPDFVDYKNHVIRDAKPAGGTQDLTKITNFYKKLYREATGVTPRVIYDKYQPY